jgi:glycosyltransferase involved in cell wall biosynthesis
MKIAMLAPPWYTVPPDGYGGIETVVHLLTEELVALGDEVTLYAAGGSRSSGELRTFYEQQQARYLGAAEHVIVDSAQALFAYRDLLAGDFDLINDHSGYVAGTLGVMLGGPPILHTVHGAVTDVNRLLYGLWNQSERIFFNCISDYQRRQVPELRVVGTVFNAIDPALYPLERNKQDYLVQISRVCVDKGQHLAIAVARRAGVPLKLAGKVENTREGQRYFAEQIKPQLGNGVEYLGEIDLKQKVALLQKARAFIFPISWPEPFGLVTIEALACGTPVIASPHGAVEEIIRDGVEGFLADDVAGMLRAFQWIDTIDPARCRRRVEESFSPPVMARRYQETYREVLRRCQAGGVAQPSVAGTMH